MPTARSSIAKDHRQLSAPDVPAFSACGKPRRSGRQSEEACDASMPQRHPVPQRSPGSAERLAFYQ
jgi:hypothetical protein